MGILIIELDVRVDNVIIVRYFYKKLELCGVRLVGNGIKNYGFGVVDVLISCIENIFEKFCIVIVIINFLGIVYKY